MKKETKNKLWIVTAYSIAMGFLEAAVVIYLRKIYYSSGFDFPLKGFIDPSILSIEWIREFGTIVMLLTIGLLAGKSFYDKLAYFIYSFAIWDIFYYLFLKLYLGWPSSLLTWDLLFLIPWPWIGPVLAPLICTVLMIISTFILLNLVDEGSRLKSKPSEIFLVIIGALIIIFTWIYDYGKLIIGNGFFSDFFTLATNQEFINVVGSFVPQNYNWVLFCIGLAISSLGIIKFYLRNR